jgi:hypothetical protein
MLRTIALLSLTLLAGCQRHYFTDSVDLELDFRPIGLRGDALHSPYVIGSSFDVFANPNDSDDSREGWRIVSSDPSVLAIEMMAPGTARANAVSDGEATLELYDAEDNLLHSEEIEVRAPASAELLWHGSLLVGATEDEARVDDARILTGGTATFLVRWRDEQGRRLSGNGALRASAQAGMETNVAQSFLFEDRDWLQLTTLEDGVYAVEVAAGDQEAVTTFQVTTVSNIAGITLEGESEQGEEDGACLVVVAVGSDADGNPVYGVEYEWDVEGDSLPDYGDVLHYTYDPNIPVTVGATFEDQHVETVVHSSGGFYVSSTNDIGCSAADASSLPTAVLPIVIGLGLIIRRRIKVSRA